MRRLPFHILFRNAVSYLKQKVMKAKTKLKKALTCLAHSATVVVPVAASLTIAMPSWAVSLFLTGHDPDFHALLGENLTGARNINQVAINFVMAPSFNTFVSNGVNKFLFVESKISPPRRHVNGVNGIIASGYTLGTDFDHHDANTLNAALDQLGSIYSAIVVASDFGGVLTQAELDILNTRADDIVSFLNAGGGLYAMAESNSGAHLTPGGGQLGFLPFVTTSTPLEQSEIGYTVTPFGASLGLTNSDINGNFSHTIFNGTFGLNVVDRDASGNIVSLAGRNLPTQSTSEPSFALGTLVLGALGISSVLKHKQHQKA